ncbi:MAG: M56 family metallopeptidase [Candidatus Levybacteria bacterium]|nr:M56 family metallopeptidase [Candidatus Levybacteria bacterium]
MKKQIGKITSKNNITKLIKNLGLEKRTAIISSNEKFAFCLGIKTPKIYISTGLISYLSLKEIEAVLRHEQYHLQNHDTFITVVASIAHFLFPFFPLLDDLIKRYRVEREIAADKFAVKQLGDSYYLLSALRKLLTFPTIGIIPLTAIADQDTLEPRIYSLVNKHYSRKHFRIKHLFITIFSSFVIGFIAIAPVYAKEIHHKEQDLVMFCSAENDCIQSCMDNKNINKLYSDSKNLLFTPTTKLPIDK